MYNNTLNDTADKGGIFYTKNRLPAGVISRTTREATPEKHSGERNNMKREFLKELLPNITKEQLDAIMAENGKDIQTEQGKTNTKEEELKAANSTIKGLQNDIKKFDGVDVEDLRNKADGWKNKYDTDIKAERTKADNIRKEYALKDALKGKGVTDPDYLIYKQGGVEKFAFDGEGKAIGLDDVLKPFQESSPSLFTEESAKNNGSVRVDMGAGNDDNGSGSTNAGQAFNALIRGAINH